MKNRLVVPAMLILYGCAALQFIRYYCERTYFYLRMPAYLAGRERLPFQERVFPLLILKPLANASWITHLAHTSGAFTSERAPFYLLSLAAFVIAAIYTQRLYHLLTSRALLGSMVFPVFLFAALWTYAIHTEADFSYPYDLSSLAFFTAGLFYIYSRRFLPLLLVILVGTTNRESTIFLIGIFVLDAASTGLDTGAARFDLRLIPWWRVAVLGAIWVAVKLSLAHHFAANDRSEDILRLADNLHQLKPRLLPALLNICGYTLPLVVLFQKTLAPERFRNYLWILLLWIPAVFCAGILVETRVYGELCSFSAVALVLIMERSVEARLATATPASEETRLYVAASHKPAA